MSSETGRSPGQLIVIAAPSGAGKSSLVNAMLETDPLLALSISHTTRPMRPGEKEAEHYHFVTQDDFRDAADKGEYLEHARVFGHWYGTSRATVAAALDKGQDIILEIDWQGAQQVRQQFPDCCLIFILPPSVEALRERLFKRGQDEPEVIERRMRKARREMAHYHEFDYLIINDQFDQALAELLNITSCMRLRTRRQQRRHKKVLEELLKSP